MEDRESKIKEAMKESCPEEFEMNIILDDLDIQEWRWPSNASDEIDNPVDEPLGKYTPDELKKYTDKDLQVKIDYGYGRLWEGEKDRFIQVVRIYEKETIISVSYWVWHIGCIDNGGIRLKVIRVT